MSLQGHFVHKFPYVGKQGKIKQQENVFNQWCKSGPKILFYLKISMEDCEINFTGETTDAII